MRRSSPICSPVLLAMPLMSARIASISGLWRSTKVTQPAPLRGHALDPLRIELVAAIVAQEDLAVGAAALGEPQQPALERVEAPVDVVELLDQAFDPVRIEVDLVDQLDHLAAGLLVARIELGVGRLVVLQAGEPLLLQGAHPIVGQGDLIEGLQHAVLDRGLHRRERQGALVEIVLVLAFGLALGRRRSASPPRPRPLALGLGLLTLGRRLVTFGGGLLDALRLGLAVLALGLGAIGRLEIDHVAQQGLALADRVAPADDRAHRQRALAQSLEHGVAPGLDPLGDLDLALAREQLDRAHLAQVHAHRIVGAAKVLVVDRGRALGLVLPALELILGAAVGAAAILLAADAHAHLVEHEKELLHQLVGRVVVLGQGSVDLAMGDHAALAGLGQEPLESRRAADQFLQRMVRPALARQGLDRRGPSCDSTLRHAAVPSLPNDHTLTGHQAPHPARTSPKLPIAVIFPGPWPDDDRRRPGPQG